MQQAVQSSDEEGMYTYYNHPRFVDSHRVDVDSHHVKRSLTSKEESNVYTPR